MADNNRVYGAALVASVVGLIVTVLFHPTGAQIRETTDAFEHELLVNILVHALALSSLWLSLVGLIGLSRQLGLARADVAAALSAFALAVMSGTIAGSINGFVVTELARSMATADEAARSGLQILSTYSRHVNGVFAKLHVATSSLAILLWSVAMLRTQFTKVLPFVGFAAALVGVAVFFNGRLHMNVHDLMYVVLGQSVWMAWAAVLLIRRSHEAN